VPPADAAEPGYPEHIAGLPARRLFLRLPNIWLYCSMPDLLVKAQVCVCNYYWQVCVVVAVVPVCVAADGCCLMQYFLHLRDY
jgi:hypothetical protein